MVDYIKKSVMKTFQWMKNLKKQDFTHFVMSAKQQISFIRNSKIIIYYMKCNLCFCPHNFLQIRYTILWSGETYIQIKI
ncbi:unnamed protein product [Paramecium primaurelia]|uniref:Uncharacterized protein n=1 Tax=Paramecium primaurelia TaxID=5886 RepID=A0A8S1NYN8_PARPR|nr:unnamed protein product [Paramecium primaurelia]